MKNRKDIVCAALDGAQNNKVRVRVSDWVTRSRSKLLSAKRADCHQKPTNVIAQHLGRQMGKRTENALSWTKLPGSSYRGPGKFLSVTGKEQKLAWETQEYRLDTVGISSTKRRGSGNIELTVGGQFSSQVLMQPCLLKLVLAYSWTATWLSE